jgi:hypothetical protein
MVPNGCRWRYCSTCSGSQARKPRLLATRRVSTPTVGSNRISPWLMPSLQNNRSAFSKILVHDGRPTFDCRLNVGCGDTAKEIAAKTPAARRYAIAKLFKDTAPMVLRVLHLLGEEIMLQPFAKLQACRSWRAKRRRAQSGFGFAPTARHNAPQIRRYPLHPAAARFWPASTTT